MKPIQRVLAGLILTGTVAGLTGITPADAAERRVFYVSCTGSDSSNGRSQSRAWRTLARASSAALIPGDRLLLKRGCTWTGERLNAAWDGTAARPIVVANYGDKSLEKPLIRDGKNSNVKITGSHLVIRGLRSHFRPMNVNHCGQSIGTVYGFNLTGGAHHVTIRSSESSGATAGIHLSKRSSDNRVIKNKIFDNGVMTTFGANPAKDLGAWGILVRSDNNEISKNYLQNNRAACSNQGYKLMSNSVEIYEGRNNFVHHNRAKGDRVFSELGSSSTEIASGNTFEYNVVTSSLADARFITTRGSSDSFGPVNGTSVRHNTVRYTSDSSQGIVCGGGCGGGVLEVRNNIIIASEKALYADANVDLGPNIFWSTAGETVIQLPVGSAVASKSNRVSIVAAPSFVNASNNNLRLRSASVAIDEADGVRISSTDYDGDPVTGSGPDLGAFER